MTEEYISRIPLATNLRKKRGGDIIDISTDEVFISMDPPLKKVQSMKKERKKSKKSAKLKRKSKKIGCGCK